VLEADQESNGNVGVFWGSATESLHFNIIGRRTVFSPRLETLHFNEPLNPSNLKEGGP